MITAIIRHFRALRDARNRATVEAAWDAAHDPESRAVDLWRARKAHLDAAKARGDTRDQSYWEASLKRAVNMRLELGA